MDDTAFLCFERKCKYRVLAINGVEDDNFADVSPYIVATAANLPVPPASVTRDDPPSSKTAIEVQWAPVTSETDTGGGPRVPGWFGMWLLILKFFGEGRELFFRGSSGTG